MQQIIETFLEQMAEVEQRFAEAIRLAQYSIEKIDILDREATEIAAILDVLMEISEQTDLLAANAAAEAGRAGEEGARLATVAREIRELAGQTSLAVGEIKRKIEKIRNATSQLPRQDEETL